MAQPHTDQDPGIQAQKIFQTFTASADNEEAARTMAASHADNMKRSPDASEREVGAKLESLVNSLEL